MKTKKSADTNVFSFAIIGMIIGITMIGIGVSFLGIAAKLDELEENDSFILLSQTPVDETSTFAKENYPGYASICINGDNLLGSHKSGCVLSKKTVAPKILNDPDYLNRIFHNNDGNNVFYHVDRNIGNLNNPFQILMPPDLWQQ